MTSTLMKALALAKQAVGILGSDEPGGSTVTEELRKSHVKAYTRQDGTSVAEHDTKHLPTNNEGYGFHGEAYTRASEHSGGKHPGDKTDELYAEASKHLAAHTGAEPEDVRNYLDSSHGRHLGDMVQNEASRNREEGTHDDKGLHPDAFKKHIEGAVKNNLGGKYGIKANMEKIKKERDSFK
jgi:hypothetical protein